MSTYPGLQVFIGLFKELAPISDRAGQNSAVNKVERAFSAKQPLVLEVVDKELAIWRNPGGLDGAPVQGILILVSLYHTRMKKTSNIARA